jgi:hypothetical protein
MLPFNLPNQPFGQKHYGQRCNDFAFADRYHFPVPVNNRRITNYSEPPSTSATLHQLLQGLAPAAPNAPPVVLPPLLPAVLPPSLPGQLNHPIPA